MNVELVAMPTALHERAIALVAGDYANPPTIDGTTLADLLPLGVHVGRGWPQPDDLVGIATSPLNRLVVLDGAVVGGMGPIGGVVDGVQEVGYGIVPAVRSRGVSDLALALLVAEVFARDDEVTGVSAEVLEANTPSWHLLERLGFERADEADRQGHRRYVLARP